MRGAAQLAQRGRMELRPLPQHEEHAERERCERRLAQHLARAAAATLVRVRVRARARIRVS